MPGQLSNAQKEQRARELIALGEAVGTPVPGGFEGREVEVYWKSRCPTGQG